MAAGWRRRALIRTATWRGPRSRGASGLRRFVTRHARLLEQRAPPVLCQNTGRKQLLIVLVVMRQQWRVGGGAKKSNANSRKQSDRYNNVEGIREHGQCRRRLSFVAHRCVDKERLRLICRRRLLNKLTPDPSIIPVLSIGWCLAPREALITTDG